MNHKSSSFPSHQNHKQQTASKRLNPSQSPTSFLQPEFPFVVVKGELFVFAGFLADVLLADEDKEELVSTAWTLVVKVVVLEAEDEAAPEAGSPVLWV